MLLCVTACDSLLATIPRRQIKTGVQSPTAEALKAQICISFAKTMKSLLLTLTACVVLFQTFSVCRGRKSCWVIKGHCRKNCKSGEHVKQPCKNGNYCCTPSKADPQPHGAPPAPTRKAQSFHDNMKNVKNFPVVLSINDNNVEDQLLSTSVSLPTLVH
uniref:Beta-defensin n=1 Tax=Oryctolagus cuniculus TaxID=9986 RepID=G1TUU6_RABIT